MNVKTTLSLAVALVVLVFALYVVQTRRSNAQSDIATSVTRPTGIARDLLDDKPGDIVKVVCRRPGEPDWVFEKRASEVGDASSAEQWWMTAPSEMKVVSWEVEKFGRQLGGLQYEIAYRPGEPGAVSAKEAGLDPPEATVELTDRDGKTATVEIGRAASEQETYVRRAGDDRVCIGRSSLTNLLKSKAVEYRDKELWSFETRDATRLEITDRAEPDQPVDYVFTSDGTRWMMESPVTGRVTDAVAEAVRTLSRLRVAQWESDDTNQLRAFGLDPAPLALRVTVERAIITPDDSPESDSAAGENDESGEGEADAEDGAADLPPEFETTTYELHVSDRSPIGDATKTYVRPGDGSAVGTIMQSTIDKLRPEMKTWREMAITPVDVAAATRIEWNAPNDAMILVKKDGAWWFETDDGPAEESSVTALLRAIRDLKAVAFVDATNGDDDAFGFDRPSADIRLTIPSVEGVERMIIGGPTDPNSRRLLFARRNASASIAKVRAGDTSILLQAPLDYRDRTIIDLPLERIAQIIIDRDEPCAGGRIALTLAQQDGAWSLTAPVVAELRSDRTNELVRAVADLRADRIVATAGEASAYGLHDPAVTVAITPADASESWSLGVTPHEGHVYAMRTDRPTVYEVNPSLFDQLRAELRLGAPLSFDEKRVRALSIRIDGDALALERRDGAWVDPAEPDLPLDAKKVDDLVLRVRDLQTERYVAYGVGDAAEYGLDQPRGEIVVTLDDGAERALRVSSKRCAQSNLDGFFATVADSQSVFLLTQATIDRFHVTLDALE